MSEENKEGVPPQGAGPAGRVAVAAKLREVMMEDGRLWEQVDAPNQKAWLEKADAVIAAFVNARPAELARPLSVPAKGSDPLQNPSEGGGGQEEEG